MTSFAERRNLTVRCDTGLVIGRNDRIAWGITVALSDSQDIFELQLEANGCVSRRFAHVCDDLIRCVQIQTQWHREGISVGNEMQR